jgi:WD40 repeat protein
VEKFAACLGVSRHGLSPAELAALLDPCDPLGNVAALLRLVRPYLMRRGELLDFYHGQFREAAVTAYLDTPEKQRAAHESVATCLQVFADPNRDGRCRDAPPHALSELPHHQIRAEAWPGLIATLENLLFLEAKVTHGMTFDLAEDFTAAVDALPTENVEGKRLRLLGEALRRDIHFIARHAKDYPQALFQCLWNSAWWYDCPEVAAHYFQYRRRIEEHLHQLMEQWRHQRESTYPGFLWLRSVRPPRVQLGTPLLRVIAGHEDKVASVAFSAAGDRIVSGSWDNTARVWNARDGRELAWLRGHKGAVSGVAFSPGGARIVSGSWDQTIRIWDVSSGRELACLVGHDDAIRTVSFSPDGKKIASAGGTPPKWGDGVNDYSIRVWDVSSGRELTCMRGHKRVVESVAFSPMGDSVVSGSWDETIRIWNVSNGRELACLRGHKSEVRTVSFSRDGKRIVSGSDNGTASVWDAASGREILQIWVGPESVRSVSFSPDGHLIVSGSKDTLVRVWDAKTGQPVACLQGHDGVVCSVAFSPDGGRMISGSEDRTVRIWEASSSREPERLRGHDKTIYACISILSSY